MTTTTAPRRAIAWLATLGLAAGAAIATPVDEAHAATANGSSAMQAWGNNDFGQTQLPFDLRSGRKIVTKISMGKHHGVAATSDKQLYAWGNNVHGEGSVPGPLQNLGTIDVAAGDGFNVVLGDDFNARVWGSTPSGLDSVPAAAVAVDLLEVAAGANHALVKSSGGKVFAWGSNAKGQTTIPAGVASTTVQALAAGDGFSMALSSSGKVFAWGDNSFGQTTIPAALDGKKVVQIAAGARHALALTSENQIVAWGSNGEGALNVPALAEGDKWLQIAAGDGFSSGVAKDSPTAGVWGFGATGIRQPPVPSGSNPVSIVAGGDALVQGFRRLGVMSPPSIAGTARVGSVLTGSHATFGPTDDVTKAPEWLKVTDGVVTTVGRELAYTPVASDIGSTLAFRTNASHPTWGTAWNDTPQIEVKGTLFESAAKPVIAGEVRVGGKLKGTVTSVPAADSYRYDWYADGDYRKTSDASGEYVVQPADLGKRITLMGYADKAGYERIPAGTSEPTAPVGAMPGFEIQAPPTVTGVGRPGSVLSLTPGRVSPAAAATAYQWLRNGQPIAGASGDSYVPVPTDTGSVISIAATYSGPARVATTSTSTGVAISNAPSVVTVKVAVGKKPKSKKAKRKVTLALAASAPGVAPLTGNVTIRDGKKVLRTVPLRAGKRTVVLKLKRGKHALTVTYLGTTGVGGSSTSRTLRLR